MGRRGGLLLGLGGPAHRRPTPGDLEEEEQLAAALAESAVTAAAKKRREEEEIAAAIAVVELFKQQEELEAGTWAEGETARWPPARATRRPT
jgi:GAF domain-containing protein